MELPHGRNHKTLTYIVYSRIYPYLSMTSYFSRCFLILCAVVTISGCLDSPPCSTADLAQLTLYCNERINRECAWVGDVVDESCPAVKECDAMTIDWEGCK